MMTKKSLLYIISIVILILFIPLVAMQFTTEINWNLFDFIIAGVLLLGFGFLIEFVIRKLKNSKYKVVAIIALIIILILIWTELAVGVFDSPIAGN